MEKINIISETKIEFKVLLILTEAETKALNEITKYGADAFLAGYYKQLGKSYLQPHEAGVRSLFNTIKKELPNQLYKIRTAWNAIIEALTPLKK